MIPATFGYTKASTIDEALSALSSSDDAKVLGGGQSLLPVLRLRLNAPELVVDCSAQSCVVLCQNLFLTMHIPISCLRRQQSKQINCVC